MAGICIVAARWTWIYGAVESECWNLVGGRTPVWSETRARVHEITTREAAVQAAHICR